MEPTPISTPPDSQWRKECLAAIQAGPEATAAWANRLEDLKPGQRMRQALWAIQRLVGDGPNAPLEALAKAHSPSLLLNDKDLASPYSAILGRLDPKKGLSVKARQRTLEHLEILTRHMKGCSFEAAMRLMGTLHAQSHDPHLCPPELYHAIARNMATRLEVPPASLFRAARAKVDWVDFWSRMLAAPEKHLERALEEHFPPTSEQVFKALSASVTTTRPETPKAANARRLLECINPADQEEVFRKICAYQHISGSPSPARVEILGLFFDMMRAHASPGSHEIMSDALVNWVGSMPPSIWMKLYEKSGFAPNDVVAGTGQTVLEVAMNHLGVRAPEASFTFAKDLIRAGFDLNRPGSFDLGMTPVHAFFKSMGDSKANLEKQWEAVLMVMLEHGADLEHRGRAGRVGLTPVQFAPMVVQEKVRIMQAAQVLEQAIPSPDDGSRRLRM